MIALLVALALATHPPVPCPGDLSRRRSRRNGRTRARWSRSGPGSRAVLHRLELRLGERVVVRDMRARVALGDAQVGQQQRDRLGVIEVPRSAWSRLHRASGRLTKRVKSRTSAVRAKRSGDVAAEADQLARRFGGRAISRATSTNALSAGDTWARLGKYRKNPGTTAAYCSRTRRRLPRRSSSAISGSNM